MGKESMSRYGFFQVQLDNQNYSPGQQVNGSIYADLKMDFPASTIIMKLEGKEKTKWWESHQVYSHTDAEGRTHHRTEWYPVFGRHRVINYEFPIAAFNGLFVPRGQYQIPFTFALPANIPNTFHKQWVDYGECYGKIHYEIKAKMESAHGKDLLKYKQSFIVNQNLNQNVQSKAVHVKKEVVCFCCCGKGEVKISGYFEKNAYCPGETCYMVSEVENNTSVKLSELQGVFEQFISLRANGWYGSRHRSFKDKLAVVHGTSLEPGETRVGANAERIQVPLTGTAIRGGEDAGEKGGFNTTTKGTLVECDYVISARCEMDTCICCDEHPAAKIPLLIYNTNTPKPNPFAPPPSWAPQVYDPYVANLNAQYMCTDPNYDHEKPS